MRKFPSVLGQGSVELRRWRCTDCDYETVSRINPVACPDCEAGELQLAPRTRIAMTNQTEG